MKSLTALPNFITMGMSGSGRTPTVDNNKHGDFLVLVEVLRKTKTDLFKSDIILNNIDQLLPGE